MLNNIGKIGDSSHELVQLQQELEESLKKKIEKKDLIRLNEVDAGVMQFINHVRGTMEWGEKKLTGKEAETMFAILDETHDKVMRGLRRIIADFSKRRDNDNPYFQAE